MDAVKIFTLFLFPLVLLLPLVSLRKALILYVIGSLIFPYLHVGELFIRFELIFALWLFAVLLAKTMIKHSSLRVPETAVLYSLYLTVVFISTLIALHLQEQGGQIFNTLIVLYGLTRPLLVLLVFSNIKIDPKFVRSIMWVFLVLSLGINAFSVIQFLGVEAAPRITEQFYLSPAVRGPFDLLMATHGRLLRPMSVFGSPIYNAAYTLIVLLICLNMFRFEENAKLRGVLYLMGGLAAIAGIMTLSVTFLLGAVVMIGIVLWQNMRFPRRFFRLARSGVVIGIVVLFIFWFSPIPQELVRGGLAYQIQRITTLELFATRYAPEEGALASMRAVILENPIMGVGATRGEDVFVGDSLYVMVLHQGGLVGLVFYLAFFYFVIKRSVSAKNLPGTFGFLNSLVFQITLLLLIVGLGIPTFHIRRMSEWYWVLLGMSANRNLRRADQE